MALSPARAGYVVVSANPSRGDETLACTPARDQLPDLADYGSLRPSPNRSRTGSTGSVDSLGDSLNDSGLSHLDAILGGGGGVGGVGGGGSDGAGMPSPRRHPGAERLRVALALGLLGSGLFLMIRGVQDDWVDAFTTWAANHEYQATVVIVALFVPSALLFAPVDMPLYLIAGFMYGFPAGFAITYVGYNLGAWCGFATARSLFRDWFVRQTHANDYISAIRAAVSENALLLVLLLSLAPMMTYSMVCYFFGASDCPFPTFVAGTAVGVIPNIAFFVFIGSTMKDMAVAAQGDASGQSYHSGAYWYWYWCSGAAAVATVALLGAGAKRQLDAIAAGHIAKVAQQEGGPTPQCPLQRLTIVGGNGGNGGNCGGIPAVVTGARRVAPLPKEPAKEPPP